MSAPVSLSVLEPFQLPFMQQALWVGLLMATVLPYFGVHVVRRNIVFIDLALAQISALGAVAGLATGTSPPLTAMGFTLLAALVFSALHAVEKRVSQEAVIGVAYAVASAGGMMILSKLPHGDADVTDFLFGNILAVTPEQLGWMAGVFGGIALLHAVLYRQFLPVTPARGWNLLFYVTLAVAISMSIKAAGVLLVFAYLIIPATAALLLTETPMGTLLLAWLLAAVATLLGLLVSFHADFPSGTAIVTALGGLFVLACAAQAVKSRKPANLDLKTPAPGRT